MQDRLCSATCRAVITKTVTQDNIMGNNKLESFRKGLEDIMALSRREPRGISLNPLPGCEC